MLLIRRSLMMVIIENKDIQNNKGKYKVDRTFLRRLKLCLIIIFGSPCSNSSLLFVLLLGLCLGQQLVVYNVGLLPSEFFEVLGNKDTANFKLLTIKAFSLIIAVALYYSLVTFVSGYLYLHWRRSLTKRLHQKYFMKSTLYYINVIDDSIDNVDQRITQDVDRFCVQLSEISAKLIISPLTITYYSVQCFHATSYIGPLTIYIYFIVGTIANKLIMSPIVNLIFKQEKYEGDFRFKHTEVRSFAESIAFLKSERNEYHKLEMFFQKLWNVQRKIVHTELFLNFSTNLFDYIGSILSYIVISVPIFSGKYNDMSSVELVSLISRNAFVSIYLISCFSSLINLSLKITDLCGYTHRIGELLETFKKEICCNKERLDSRKESCVDEKVLIKLTDVTYSPPCSTNLLVSNLNLSIQRNSNLLITGNTGTGKSSLLRILSGLWQPSSGKIQSFISPNNVLFLPQKPYLTTGTLMDQVIYPLLKHEIPNYIKAREKAMQALEDVGLDLLIDRIGDLDLEPMWHWLDGLSPGEIQRLSFARLFYHRPILAIVDEPTSALGIIEEECFYTYCHRLGITTVSVGHRETVKQFHDVCLKISGDGKWECYPI